LRKEKETKMFRITGGKGFHITFENDYTVSVQFGSTDYCSNCGSRKTEEVCGEDGATTVECAIWKEENKSLIKHKLFGKNSVGNRLNAKEVLIILNWAAKQKA